jgi:hypothetical protein
MNSISDFFRLLCGTSDVLVLVPESDRWQVYQYFKVVSHDQIDTLNLTTDIYFIPNAGGKRNDQINRFRAVFVDLDAGRPEPGRYYDEGIVAAFKAKKLAEIKRFPLPPTAVVETRNGYHIHWKLYYDLPVWQWKLIIRKLITLFGGDPACTNPARLLRVPFTTWRKPYSGCDPFECPVVEWSDVSYTADELLDALASVQPYAAERPRRAAPTGESVLSAIVGESDVVARPTSSMVDAIRRGDVDFMQSVLKPKQVYLTSMWEVNEYLVQRTDLAAFLGVEDRHRCLFHDDSDPSAAIVTLPIGDEIVRCYGTNCGFTGNIRNAVARLRDCTVHEATRFLMEVFDVRLEASEWWSRERDRLDAYRTWLENLATAHPTIHNAVRGDLPTLIALIDIARRLLPDDHHRLDDDRAVVYVSQRLIIEELGLKDRSALTARLARLSFFRLLDRHGVDDLPADLSRMARCHAGANRRSRASAFYAIPAHGEEHVADIYERVELFERRPLTSKGWSVEGVCRTYGIDIALTCFPDDDPSVFETSEDSERFHDVLTEAIGERGWIERSELLSLLADQLGRTKARKTIERGLPEALDAYGLEVHQVDGRTKVELRIASRGYPKIIRRACGDA